MKNYNPVPYSDVHISGGFWRKRQDINRNTTAKAIYDRFSDTHRFEALECKWKEGMANLPHIFWDSDVAKWIEGVSYIVSEERNEFLEKLCDHAIDAIEKNQQEDGYYNCHYLVAKPKQRFTVRSDHELYCAGHLIEAACAYYNATGKDKLLNIMIKYADFIYDTFYVYQTATFMTGGHPEIELALVKLYDTTKNEKYLTLSKFFVDKRGNNDKDFVDPNWDELQYAQDHLPLKKQRTAEGHSVRALYIYSAMADIAEKFDDGEYLEACEAIFENIIEKRMYVTGGLGSTYLGESFTKDYHLPNRTSYAETCAAIAMSFFCQRMQTLKLDSRYADAIERVMYNGALSGISLDGKSFFYENSLEVDPYFQDVVTAVKRKEHQNILERVEVFWCSCCPPNVMRYIGSIGGVYYTYTDDTIYVHQFAESEANINGAKVTQKTRYPVDGCVEININGGNFKKVAVRIPGWCRSFKTDLAYTVENGYAIFEIPENQTVNIEFDMPVEMLEANTRVQNNAGKVAVIRGPIVYCIEGVDNGEMIKSINVKYDSKFEIEPNEVFGVPTLKTTGFKKVGSTALYSFANNSFTEVPLTFIPYYAYANRGATEMAVWINIK